MSEESLNPALLDTKWQSGWITMTQMQRRKRFTFDAWILYCLPWNCLCRSGCDLHAHPSARDGGIYWNKEKSGYILTATMRWCFVLLVQHGKVTLSLAAFDGMSNKTKYINIFSTLCRQVIRNIILKARGILLLAVYVCLSGWVWTEVCEVYDLVMLWAVFATTCCLASHSDVSGV